MTITTETYQALVDALKYSRAYSHYVYNTSPALHEEADGSPSTTSKIEDAELMLERDMRADAGLQRCNTPPVGESREAMRRDYDRGKNCPVCGSNKFR